jgi:hypothetical protein
MATKIIKQDFSPDDFNRIVNEFLFSDTRISLPQESLVSVRDHLVKAGPSFQKVFQAYFEKSDNTRYDNLTRRMETFAKKLLKYNADLQGEERKTFILFWNELAQIIKSDYLAYQDNYLKNSCEYFIWEIGKLS